MLMAGHMSCFGKIVLQMQAKQQSWIAGCHILSGITSG